MKEPKLVVGHLMGDKLSVKSVTISKTLDWLTGVEIEDLVEFFEGLLELITRISEGKEDSESLQVFLSLWREVALGVGDMEDEDRETFWKTLTNSIERAMSTTGQSVLVGFDDEEDDEDELDSPLIDIIDRQPEPRGIIHLTTYGEPSCG